MFLQTSNIPWTAPDTSDRAVVVLGAGLLGRRVAASWACGGYLVRIRDPEQRQREAALEYIRVNRIHFNPHLDPPILRVELHDGLEAALEGAFLVVECVPEVLELKQDTFRDLAVLAPKDAILASNSSSYKSREMVEGLDLQTRRRVLNTHYIMPPGKKLVELMTCGDTDADVLRFVAKLLSGVGMLPMLAKRESTGFIVNRIWAAIKRETLMVLEEDVASPDEIDAAWTDMFIQDAIPPCRMMDLVGLDTVSLIEQHYIEERKLPDVGVVAYLQKYIDEGRLGAKSNKGGLYRQEVKTLID